MNIIKKEIIDSLLVKAIELSKNPKLLDNGLILTSSNASDVIGDDYFSIRKDNSINNIIMVDKTHPIIYVNLSDFELMHDITKIYIIMFGSFMYYASFFNSLFFPSYCEKETDVKTIKYLIDNDLLNADNYKELLTSLGAIIYKYGDNVKVRKRITNILNVIPMEFRKN